MSNGMYNGNSDVKIIKRYQNRKLYDTQTSRYTTLPEIGKMICQNQEVMVIDSKSKMDLTSATLIKIIFEAGLKDGDYPPIFILREIIQNGNGSLSEYLAKLGVFPIDQLNAAPKPVIEPPVQERKSPSFNELKLTLQERVAMAVEEANGTKSPEETIFKKDQPIDLPHSNNELLPQDQNQ